MKKFVLILLLAGFFSVSGFANAPDKPGSKTVVNEKKTVRPVLSLHVVKGYTAKGPINKLYATFTVGLSCVTITYTGATAEAGIALTLAGYGGLLQNYLEWYWCQGGYQPPPTVYLYA